MVDARTLRSWRAVGVLAFAIALVVASGPAPAMGRTANTTGPPAIADAPPTDPDGDGLYEDLNGNGHWGFPDVNLLFQHTDDPRVVDHTAAYDFDGDGQVDMQDVLALFEHDRLVARATLDPAGSVTPGTTVTLDGRNSTASTSIDAYTWRVNGSRVGAGETATIEVTDPGPKRVTLTVRDADGRTATTTETITVRSADQRVIGYYRSWSRYQRDYRPADVPLDRVTHLNYAFLDVRSNGTVVLGDSWGDRQNLRAFRNRSRAHPETTMLLSIGGWSYSEAFSDAAMTPERRERFAESAVRIMRTYEFDGIDVDWEYPGGGGAPGNTVRPDDAHNFTLLMETLDEHLERAGEADGREYTTSIAVSADPEKVDRLEWDRLEAHVDLVNLMTYDYGGPWSETTGHNAPLDRPETAAVDSVSEATRSFADTGYPMERVQVGVPFYGRGFAGVENGTAHVGQAFSGTPDGTYGTSGVYTARDIEQRLNDSAAGYRFHEAAAAPTLYLPDREILISYENERSIRAKARFARRSGTGGVMVWALGQDPRARLLAAIRAALTTSDRPSTAYK
ncbi:glycosyl hydrolase family 18 protein [Halococcoides cellulosivorans]|uniref:Chitinase n=1 Tax=Halococcoides cellulosivorans TaxID=1679096 RepID=A0A2R4WZY7_9EURY|nr:glycosyl hydrolase family 18 protein [Halococcoides cellulosivorans]AWB27116.1 chitinase [Halococcoides cellulosivorans]